MFSEYSRSLANTADLDGEDVANYWLISWTTEKGQNTRLSQKGKHRTTQAHLPTQAHFPLIIQLTQLCFRNLICHRTQPFSTSRLHAPMFNTHAYDVMNSRRFPPPSSVSPWSMWPTVTASTPPPELLRPLLHSINAPVWHSFPESRPIKKINTV